MADADLDAVIRQLAKQQNKSLMGAAKKRTAFYRAGEGRERKREGRARLKRRARRRRAQGLAGGKGLKIAENKTADSYARAIKNAMDEIAAMKPAKTAV